MMKVFDLTDEAVSKNLNQILEKLNKSNDSRDREFRRTILEMVVDELDYLNEDDFFGTEGWEHYFGFDD